MCIFFMFTDQKNENFPSHLETFLTEYVTENDCRLEEFSFLYFLVIFSLVSCSLLSIFQIKNATSIPKKVDPGSFLPDEIPR